MREGMRDDEGRRQKINEGGESGSVQTYNRWERERE